MLKPEEVVRQLIEEMYAWEVWANELDGRVDAGELDWEKAREERLQRYFEIVDRFALSREVSHGASHGLPTNYHPTETIESVELNGSIATIRTQQHHHEAIDDLPDINCQVIYILKHLQGEWKITGRTTVDERGKKYDVGI